MLKKLFGALVIVAALAATSPAGTDPQGFTEEEFAYGWFYGTFNESPNIALFAGGPLEEFCVDDPGLASSRVFMRNDGSVDIKVNEKDQSIYLYESDFNDIPVWLDAICPGIVAGEPAPEPFASGTADMKVRISDGPADRTEIFNSVNGKATGTDGTRYKVSGSADFAVEGGMLIGDPQEFVGFKLTVLGGR